MSSTLGSDFVFPSHYAYPPFYTLQPISSTRASQLLSWSSFILSYCRFYRLFTLNLTDALSSPLFQNTKLNRRLSAKDTRAVLDWMASKEGGETIEWIRDNNGDSGRESKCWVYWRRPEEWGSLVQEWVEETGQKGSVLTLYEIVEGDMTNNQEFHGMPMELFQKSMQVLVKKGKATVFTGSGQDDAQGVKFL